MLALHDFVKLHLIKCIVIFAWHYLGLILLGLVISFYLGADQVLLRDPSDDNVVPVVEVLRRRLRMANLNHEHHKNGNSAVPDDVETAEEDGISYLSRYFIVTSKILESL